MGTTLRVLTHRIVPSCTVVPARVVRFETDTVERRSDGHDTLHCYKITRICADEMAVRYAALAEKYMCVIVIR